METGVVCNAGARSSDGNEGHGCGKKGLDMTTTRSLLRIPCFPMAMAVGMIGGVATCSLAQSTAAATNAVSTNATSSRLRTWELPPVSVNGQTGSVLREEERVGPADQPRWTTDRRFPRVRIYTIPDGDRELEYWTRVDVPKDGQSEIQHFFEFEMGLPYRLQFDTYLILRSGDPDGDGGHKDQTYVDGQFEMRWALADWGVLPGNPTLYGEYVWREALADKVEGKLLFGDELAPRWHWGVNFVVEDELSSEDEAPGEHCSNEYSVTAGLSYSLLDEKLSIGVEAEDAYTNFQDHRDRFENEIFVGPSIQYRPSRYTHINLLPLIGVRGDEAAKIFLNVGWEF